MEEFSDCTNCQCLNPLFKSLTESELKLFNENKYSTKYKAGEIIFKQGTAMTHIMIFVAGLAKVYIEGLDNRNLILRFVTPGILVSGPGMHVDFRHHFSVSAIHDSYACFIDVNAFDKVNKENPDFAFGMIKETNAQNIFNFGKFIGLTQKQMPGRIADALLYLSEEIYKKNPFDLTISRQDLADLTAMSKESAIRILKQFRSEGIIRANKKTLEIVDKTQLRKISELG